MRDEKQKGRIARGMMRRRDEEITAEKKEGRRARGMEGRRKLKKHEEKEKKCS